MLCSWPPTRVRRRSTGLIAGLCLSAAACLPAQAHLLVVVHRSTQVMDVSSGGVLLARWPVSTARPGFVTPAGAYRPTRLERMWRSSKYEWAPMPHSIFFRGGYAIHGTFETRPWDGPYRTAACGSRLVMRAHCSISSGKKGKAERASSSADAADVGAVEPWRCRRKGPENEEVCMSILAMMAVAGTLACANCERVSRCSILVEVSGRRTHRLSCAGLLPPSRNYTRSMSKGGSYACFSLPSLQVLQRRDCRTSRSNQPAQQPSSSPTPRREPNSATPEPQP